MEYWFREPVQSWPLSCLIYIRVDSSVTINESRVKWGNRLREKIDNFMSGYYIVIKRGIFNFILILLATFSNFLWKNIWFKKYQKISTYSIIFLVNIIHCTSVVDILCNARKNIIREMRIKFNFPISVLLLK